MIDELLTFPWNALLAGGVLLLMAAAVLTTRARRHAATLEELEPVDEVPATAGAQRQIDELREQVRHSLKANRIVVGLLLVGFFLTGWQVTRAFENLEDERLARVSALASINTFLCQRIDEVGNGVATLVAVQVDRVPNEERLTEEQREALQQYREYVEKQERPPRCRELALKVATLTGADPGDVVITPIRLHPDRAQHSSDDGPAKNP